MLITIRNKHTWFYLQETYVTINCDNINNITLDNLTIIHKGQELNKNNLVYLLNFLVSFFTVSLDNLLISNENYNTCDIMDIIYNLDLHVDLINTATCCCNMGHCDMPIDYKIEKSCSKIKDIFELLCESNLDKINGTYYEYPESCFICLNQVNDEIYSYNNHEDYYKKTNGILFKLDNNKQYIQFFYS